MFQALIEEALIPNVLLQYSNTMFCNINWKTELKNKRTMKNTADFTLFVVLHKNSDAAPVFIIKSKVMGLQNRRKWLIKLLQLLHVC